MVGADIGRRDRLNELTVAIVHHADHIGLDALDERDQISDLCHGKCRSRQVSLAPLDLHKLCVLVDRSADAVIIKRIVGKQFNLSISDSVLRKRPRCRRDADDLLERVVRFPYRREDLVARAHVRRHCKCQCVCAAGDLCANECTLRVEHIGVHCLERVSSEIVVAVTRVRLKALCADSVLLHRGNDLHLADLRRSVDLREALR